MILLRLLAWPYVRKHLLRTALTTAGIALGVAVFVAMHAANDTVLSAFGRTVDRIAGRTQLQVTAGDAGFGEDILERVQSVRSVRVAVPIIEAVVDSRMPGQGNLLVLGIDMTGDRTLRDYDLESADDAVLEDPLIFLAQPDSIILTQQFAQRTGTKVGSKLRLGTAIGDRIFTVRGLMKSEGLSTAFGGNIAIMDVYAVQHTFGRGRTFDRIDLAVKEGVSLEASQHELRALLGPGFEVAPPASRGQQFESVLAGYSVMVTVSSAFALFIGLFIIYSAASTSVAQRRSEIGILRALGTSRAQIYAWFLGESAVLGVVGSLVGLAIGMASARAIAASISSLIADVYGISQPADELVIAPAMVALAVGIGVMTSIAAALIPSRQAARVDPVVALQRGKREELVAQIQRVRLLAAAACIAYAGISLFGTGHRVMFYSGYGAGAFGVLLLMPMFVQGLARAIRPLLMAIRPVEGALAVDSLLQAPQRATATVTALTLSLALVIAFSGMARASYTSIVDWMEATLNPDLFVQPSASLELQSARFPADMQEELAAIDGVARVQWFRNGRITFRDRPAMVVAIEMESVARTAPRAPVLGDGDRMYRAAAAGEGVIVSDNLRQLHGLRLGDEIDIEAPYGVIRLPVVGAIVDYSDQQGAILIDRAVFTRYWHDDGASDFRVYVAQGTPVADVRDRILQRYSGHRQVFVLTNAELKSYILNVTNQWFGLTNVQIAIAVLVAILGIVNSLTVSITDRRRELGVLSAVGALRSQVRATIWLEAAAVATAGLVLGGVLGAVNLYYVLDIVRRDVAGMTLDYSFPVPTALGLIPLILFTAWLAALWPAENAVRGSLVEALQYE